MSIKYENKFLLKFCENQQIFEKRFPTTSFKQFQKSKNYIIASKNIGEVQKHTGLKIEKLKGLKNIGSFRFSKKWRVNFTYEEIENFLEVEKIIIIKIHPHKY